MDNKTLYQEVVKKWGEKSQLGMAQEEAAELIQAISKYNRAVQFGSTSDVSKRIEELASEVADVSIMLEQIIQIFDITDVVSQAKEYKLNRLENRLKNF